MSFPKFLLIGSCLLFALIGAMGIVKKKSHQDPQGEGIELVVQEKKMSSSEPPKESSPLSPKSPVLVKTTPSFVKSAPPMPLSEPVVGSEKAAISAPKEEFPVVDRMFRLFTTGPMKLPIVETVTYSSSVPWLKGRPAWVADYASHYQTSRHFIARSLNGKPDYFKQKVSTGSRFNVFRTDKKIEFYLLIDVSRCKMGFYYVDLDTQERVLLKTYDVGLGRLDATSPSGTLTPLGKYSLGQKVAIYKPGVVGPFQEGQTEMVRIFGTRWIPFDEELEGATEQAKGYGIHGAPWKEGIEAGSWVENRNCIGAYDSDGCIRLSLEDMEELFAIVITKPTYVVIVKDFQQAKLPGVEVVSLK